MTIEVPETPTAEEWTPLIRCLAGQFMFMYLTYRPDGRIIYSYKHRDSRHYLHLDEQGRIIDESTPEHVTVPTPRKSPPKAAAIASDIKRWWEEECTDWDAAVTGADSATPPGGTDLMPTVDSKAIARTSPIFKRHLGIPLDVTLIRHGGYASIDDAIADLVPKMEAATKQKVGNGGQKRRTAVSEDTDRAALGARLKDAREYRGFSQEDVGKYLGVSRSAISLIESGARRLDILELKKLATLYECSFEDLTGEQPAQPAEPDSIKMVARAAAALSPEDRSEVLRFAQFLQTRKSGKQV